MNGWRCPPYVRVRSRLGDCRHGRARTASEDALKAADAEIRTQRARIGQLLGQIRDAERHLAESALTWRLVWLRVPGVGHRLVRRACGYGWLPAGLAGPLPL